MGYMEELGKRSKAASASLGIMSQEQRNQGLLCAAEMLEKSAGFLLEENQKDILNAKAQGMKESLIDRLMLTTDRIQGIAEGLRQIVDLEDPLGEVESMKTRPNGLMIGKKRVPLGVI